MAKTNWAAIRGNRFQVLEEEFFRFTLEPHAEALKRAYGIGSAEVAMGIQAIANSMREGSGIAAEELHRHVESTYDLADRHEISLEAAIENLTSDSPDIVASLRGILADLFMGGLCNLSRHTTLPVALLEDLSFKRGENTEFFEPGPFCGTPLRTLPGRIKPLVLLQDGFYATDHCFVRDAAYRAIQRGVAARLPEYREEWNRRQKALTEAAFARILSQQLVGARVLTEVYYPDPTTKQWVENDTLILIEDVLVQVEAKAGVSAMHSPATDFKNHVRAIRELVVRAYTQARRFLEYLASAPEVPIYELRDGRHCEVQRLRLSDFRLILPIGLTVESFSPFSTMCKELPVVEPILGKHPFVSMSIDELFVLNRILPTTGLLFHYLEVRQQIAGIRGTVLFDEMDHLGAYLIKNRFDMTLREQLREGADRVVWDGLSAEIDRYFASDRWLHEPPPDQSFPPVLQRLLAALAKTRAPDWLRMDAAIRDFANEARVRLASLLQEMTASLKDRDRRWFVFDGELPLLFWLNKEGTPYDANALVRQAEIVALALGSAQTRVLRALATPTGEFSEVWGLRVRVPDPFRPDYQTLIREAEVLQPRIKHTGISGTPRSGEAAKKTPRPNEPCSCGSGRKFKKCHGVPRQDRHPSRKHR